MIKSAMFFTKLPHPGIICNIPKILEIVLVGHIPKILEIVRVGQGFFHLYFDAILLLCTTFYFWHDYVALMLCTMYY